MSSVLLPRPALSIHQSKPSRPFLPSAVFGSAKEKGISNPRDFQNRLIQATSKAEAYLAGHVPLLHANGQSIQARILPTEPEDAQQVADWYEPKPAGEPTYTDNQKWRFWWNQKITAKESKFQVLKLVVGDNQILGVVALVRKLVDSADNRLTTWLEGIRIAPRCNSMMIAKPDYKGVGAALVTQAVVESLNEQTEGIGLNSTLGAEGFYEKMGLASKPAFDGKRTCFTIKGSNERFNFLKERFHRYDGIQSPVPITSPSPVTKKSSN